MTLVSIIEYQKKNGSINDHYYNYIKTHYHMTFHEMMIKKYTISYVLHKVIGFIRFAIQPPNC